jgi:hypothetical protein
MKLLINRITKIEVIVFILGFIGAIYMLVFAPAKYFIWHVLAKPPEPVSEIIDATIDTIIIRAISDRKYSCNVYAENTCWSEVDIEPEKGVSTWCFPNDDFTEHTVQILKACNLRHNFGVIGTVYSLNSDGAIYVKHKGYISIAGYYFGAIFGLLCSLITYFSRGLILQIPQHEKHDG